MHLLVQVTTTKDDLIILHNILSFIRMGQALGFFKTFIILLSENFTA